MKLEVMFDEEKIKSEGKYTISQIFEKWDELFYKNNINKKDELGNFIGDDNENFEDFARIIIAIKDIDWFRNYAKECYWWIDGVIEDVLLSIKLHETGYYSREEKKSLLI